MQRRLSIAMALITNPDVIFLDEPTLGLDVRARRDMWNVLKSLKGKITIVLTTHYLEEAEALSDRIGIIHGGNLCAIGTMDELKKKTNENTLEDIFIKLTEGEVA
jgi:ABC-2 type transport system ATP-binding protein